MGGGGGGGGSSIALVMMVLAVNMVLSLNTVSRFREII